MEKLMVSFKIPRTLQQELLQKIIADGYGMRGKSRWIAEAIESFLTLSDYPELVEIASDTEQLTEMTSIRISPLLMQKIEEAILEVRKAFPVLEGVKSNIVRAGIYQRLIRGHVSATDA